MRIDNRMFIICASLCRSTPQGARSQPINPTVHTMTRLLSPNKLSLCRPVAAARAAGVAAMNGVLFDGAPPGVPVR